MTIDTAERHRRPIAPYSCAGCAHTWTGLAFAHCSGCHRTFSSVSGFDRHRLRGQCVNPAERGLQLDVLGIWRLPTGPAGHYRTR